MTNKNHTIETFVTARFITFAARAIFAVGLAYLCYKVIQLAGTPGYDYKFIWVAGRMWLDGASPYSSGYPDLASSLVTEGNIPNLWVYPPNWWPVAIAYAVVDLDTSAVLWNLASVALVASASILLVKAFRANHGDVSTGFGPIDRVLNTAPALFCVHFFTMCVLEPTALVLSVGQTSLLIYFGITLLVYGVAVRGPWLQVIGLVILLLKPQIGLIFAVPLLLLGKPGLLLLLRSTVISVLLSLPAFVVEPGVIWEFLANLREYDNFTLANEPSSMTGTRIIIYEAFARDIGNIAATAFTSVVVFAVGILILRMLPKARHAEAIIIVTTALIAALAPLHTYDLVIVGVLPFIFLLRTATVPLFVTVTSGILVLRPENWALLTGFHAPGVSIFPGSRIATIGAMLIAVAVVYVVLRRGNNEPKKIEQAENAI